jgi:putative chitinase
MIEGTIFPDISNEFEAYKPRARGLQSNYQPAQSSGDSNDGFNQDENLIIQEAQKQGVDNPNQLAYILATAKHESDNFNTLEEYASGSAYEGRQDLGNDQAGDGVKYKGRGFVQLTGKNNFSAYADKTGLDLVGNPDILSQDKNLAAYVLVDGMKTGAFTGVKLDDYINSDHTNFTDARRIVNGTDRAGDIARLANGYLNKLGR